MKWRHGLYAIHLIAAMTFLFSSKTITIVVRGVVESAHSMCERSKFPPTHKRIYISWSAHLWAMNNLRVSYVTHKPHSIVCFFNWLSFSIVFIENKFTCCLYNKWRIFVDWIICSCLITFSWIVLPHKHKYTRTELQSLKFTNKWTQCTIASLSTIMQAKRGVAYVEMVLWLKV